MSHKCKGCIKKCRKCQPCDACGATGRIGADHCALCGGSGINQRLRNPCDQGHQWHYTSEILTDGRRWQTCVECGISRSVEVGYDLA